MNCFHTDKRYAEPYHDDDMWMTSQVVEQSQSSYPYIGSWRHGMVDVHVAAGNDYENALLTWFGDGDGRDDVLHTAAGCRQRHTLQHKQKHERLVA